jgi:hypothetical protein
MERWQWLLVGVLAIIAAIALEAKLRRRKKRPLARMQTDNGARHSVPLGQEAVDHAALTLALRGNALANKTAQSRNSTDRK